MGNLFVMAEVVSSFRLSIQNNQQYFKISTFILKYILRNYVLSATESLLPEFNLESMLSFVKVLLGAFGLIYFGKLVKNNKILLSVKNIRN